jgi:glucosyl-dolichyl phosphate glucuronosyltransferase
MLSYESETSIPATDRKPQQAGGTSVVICCYNLDRWDDICEAIQSVSKQTQQVQQTIVVVDHNPALQARMQAAFPTLTVIANSGERGLSGARNSGIAASTGEFLLFLDDDAVAAPDMVALLSERLADRQVLGAVARIQPDWLGPVPPWFPAEFLWVVGCTYQGMSPGRVRNLLGAAMYVRRSVFEAVGGFNSGLGRSHFSLPLGCEETEFCIRANLAHPMSYFVYDATAACRHKVPPQRLTWRYLTTRCYAEGLSKAHVAFIAQAAGALSTERAYVTKTVPAGALRGLSAFVSKGEIGGLGRAVAAGLGLGSAAVGYLVGRAMLIADPGRALMLRRLPKALPYAIERAG